MVGWLEFNVPFSAQIRLCQKQIQTIINSDHTQSGSVSSAFSSGVTHRWTMPFTREPFG